MPDTRSTLEFSSTVEIDENSAREVIPSGSGVSQSAALYGKRAGSGWFSAAYGPFRRLTGGNEEFNFIVAKRPRLAAHLSAFREDFSLGHVTRLLKDFALDSSNDKMAKELLKSLITFINASGLLHHNAVVDRIDSKGLNILDANGSLITLNEMSDGYRSILSMTLDILLRLSEIFGPKQIFQPGTNTIEVPGVIIIDEIDAHLHPTWQTEIGQWFTKYFPNIQFIVTTHSPLICRGCVNEAGELNGSIWRLAAPGSEEPSGILDDTARDRLIYGNVLDAYGTGTFGEHIERTKASEDLLKELAQLDKLYTFGQISPEQDRRRLELQKIFTTDVITEF